jgi:Tfp pilus assembly protein PilF
MVSRTLLIVLVLGLTACSATSTKQSTPAEPPVSSKPSSQRDLERQDSSAATASAGMLSRAQKARQSGDLDTAQALLQRAQRIDARNAEVYLELARLHVAQGDESGASAMAERGMLYCEGASCTQLRRFIAN